MSIAFPIPSPIYEGETVTSLVPFKWPVSLAGHPLVLDLDINRWRHTSIQLLRQQADQSQTPGEASLNPDGLWRRAQESWHHGAGQDFRDREGSDPFRFRSSLGVNVWDYYQLHLLNDVQSLVGSSEVAAYVATAGPRIYAVVGPGAYYSTDGLSFLPVTDGPGADPNGITSDGYTTYVAYGASGIWSTNTSITTLSQFNSGTINGPIKYLKGRLMAAGDNLLYNITAAGALPTPLITHSNANFRWVDFAAGPSHIYAGGLTGDKSLIYKITITEDGTELDEPTVAGELPDGELLSGMGSYLGFVFLGTSKGARMCSVDNGGNLIVGSLIHTDNPVQCFEGQDKYVWFGWSDYDSTHTGLGRMDLTVFTEDIETGARVPAYATDLMSPGSGSVLSIATFLDKTYYTVGGTGLWAETDELVTDGTLDTGLISYGLPDPKTVVYLDVRTLPLDGSYIASIAVDLGAFTSVGSASIPNDTGEEFPVGYLVGERFEVRLSLERDEDETDTGPVIVRYTLKASPGAVDGPAEYIIAPFMLHEQVKLYGGAVERLDVRRERDHIKTLRRSHQKVVYQEGENSYEVFVDSYEWIPYQWTRQSDGSYGTPNGTMVTQMKRVN